MDFRRWIARRDQDWQTLDQILTCLETKGIKSLPTEDIQQLASLYRATSADLARAQTHNLNPRLRQNLQSLITRAYGQIYQGDRVKSGTKSHSSIFGSCRWCCAKLLVTPWWPLVFSSWPV
ncbi:hypothetical protein [Synechocystis salina]|uniref:hypothetical protein n=1 Tax=Synechocystis salina TaxID=945780 RepID=UPI001D14BABF|nr:hypothetical protein [Synechocystis salina]